MPSTESTSAKVSPLDRVAPGVKIALQMSPEPREIELAFAQQLGIKYSVVWTDASKASPEYYASRKQLYADAGIEIFALGNADVHNQEALVLGGPDQAAKIEEYKRHIQGLGKAGVPYTTYAHMPNGIWSTDREPTRGGASARAFDQAQGGVGHWRQKQFRLPQTNDRSYTVEESWDNFATFIRQAARVAEDEGVMIGIHPADPPLAMIGGVPRLFSHIEDYKRAFELAESPNVGVCLCVGCWLEGGAQIWGVDVLEAIRYFLAEKRLFKVHFRNVDAPLPHFVETFIDDGYQDM